MYKKTTFKPKFRGVKSLSHALDIITRPVFLKRGFAENRIITDWNKVVGESISACSVPRKLTFMQNSKINGTLYIEVSNSGFATEMVYLEPMILEKIAGYFGYKAVSRLKILQNPKNQPIAIQKKPTQKSLSPESNAGLEAAIAGIDDVDLQDSLRSLGHTVLSDAE